MDLINDECLEISQKIITDIASDAWDRKTSKKYMKNLRLIESPISVKSTWHILKIIGTQN